MLKKFRNADTIIFQLLKTLSLVWSASRYWTAAWMILLVIQGVLPAAGISLTREIVDSLVAVAGDGMSSANIEKILTPVVLMAAILLASEFLGSAGEWIRTAQSELVNDYITDLVQKQSVAVDYAFYENSESYDQLDRARDGATGRSLALLESTGSLLQNSITMFAIAAVLIPYGPWLPLVLIASAIPAFYVLMYLNRIQYEWSQRRTTDRRRLMYFDLLLTNSATAAEVRLFDFTDYFQSAYKKIRQRLVREQLQLLKKQTVGRSVAGLMALIVSAGVLAWMGRQVLIGAMTIGDLALFFQGFNQGQGIVKSVLSNLGQIYRNSLFIGNLFEFLQIKPEIIDPPNPVPVDAKIKQGIQFREVTFRYPGCESAVLENFNLTLPAGKMVAIVGDNGAGKSTLIKLLCRFYDPQSGSIEIDGVDFRNLAVKELRRLITVLFQSPIPYYTSAAENIGVSDISTGFYQEDIVAAAKASGIHDKIAILPQGYETLLGKWFPQGTDLSGGQWQRLALARAFYRQAPFMILDEPTSAMDPWAERDWLERFRILARDKTAVVITHRFTLAMRADIIHVMRAGEIVESGSHDELLALGGMYAESWKTQMESNSTQVAKSGIG